jgi:tetratricopeptide (TPR) repeat protein
MKKILPLFIISVLLLNLISCGKKQKEPDKVLQTEEALILIEKTEAEVKLPRPQWSQSLAILNVSSLPQTANPFGSLFTERLVQTIGGHTSLKTVMINDASRREDTDYLLTSEVTKDNGVIKADVRIRDIDKDSTIFNKSYQKEIGSFLVLTEQISADLPSAIISSASVSTSPPNRKLSPVLMDNYIEAVSLYRKSTHKTTDEAVKIFKNILTQDSSFVPAYTGLARCYLQIIYNQWNRNLIWLKLARETASKALQKGEVAESHCLLGKVFIKYGDYKQAEDHFRKAVTVNPNLAEAWTGLGNVYNFYGLYNPGMKAFSTALELDPEAVDTRISLCMLHIGLKQYKESYQIITGGITLHPDKLFLHSFAGLALLYQNDLNKAEKEIAMGLQSNHYTIFSQAVSALIQARKGNFDQALAEVELEVKPYVNNKASLATAVAAVYALLERKGLAVEWIQKAHDFGFKEYPWLINDPHYNNLRDDERFIAIMDTLKKEWEKNLKNYTSPEIPAH